MRKLTILLAAVLTVLLLASCQSKASPKLLVPTDSNLIANVQVSKLLADVDWAQLYSAIPSAPGEKPPSLSDALDQLFQETGIDVRFFTEATLFARIPDEYVGAALVGSFDEAKFIQNLEEKTGEKVTRETFEGHTLYFEPEQGGGLTFVGKDLMVAGTAQALKDAMSVADGKKSSISGDIKTAYDDLGTPLAKVVFAIPDQLRQQMLKEMGGGSSGMPLDLSPLAGVSTLAVSLDKSSQDLTLLVKGRYDTADAAQKAQSVLEGTRMLLGGLIPVPEISAFLNKVQVSRQESWVSLNLKASVDEIKGLAEALSKLDQ